jgi:hypothetical protein
LRESPLLKELIGFAGPDKHVQIIPYANTPEFLDLAAALRAEHGFTVDLPESPSPQDLWLGAYLDSKAGFRTLVSQLAPDALPFGFLCESFETALQAVNWFKQKKKACVIKASQGGSGVGNLFLGLEQLDEAKDLNKLLGSNAFMREDIFIVEEQIHSSSQLSPSLEFFVPPPERGQPNITYLSNQLFERSGRFAGVAISRELESEAWYAGFKDTGLRIARHIQEMGFVGHFDLDAIVDDEGRLYLVEINARRTGGTFAHEFMLHNFGADYMSKFAVLSENKLGTNGVTQLDDLKRKINGLLFQADKANYGIIPTLTSMLPQGYIGYIALGDSLKAVQDLRASLISQLGGEA